MELVRLARHLGRVLLMPEPVCRTPSWAAAPHRIGTRGPFVDPWTGRKHVKHDSDPERVRRTSCQSGALLVLK